MSNFSDNIIAELRAQADPVKASILQGFFKTGPGEYAEGDLFLGVVVPKQRAIAKKHLSSSLEVVEELLHNKYHEVRLTALIILTYQFPIADETSKRKIFDFYLKNTKYINNWDLVDVSCPNIIGAWTYKHDRSVIYKLAKSANLWERRMAVLACFYYIRRGETKDILLIAEQLINDKQDLIHKAVGWMLREVGKNCGEDVLRTFLSKHKDVMPRTMLRYAIERLPETIRQAYLKKD